MIYQSITYKPISNKINSQILYYKNKSGYIIGYKNIYNGNKVPIVQFKDFTRIWILPKEINKIYYI
uniref:Cytochrome b6-f complex subunit PetP n=1 Tax=Antithamnionella ternifolia TaxID=207919 RepID=A0A4D6WJR7_9FLOR|nr:cytochrome b6-f complex subunit PetP [Antithamnionella ternifolia]